MMLNLSLRGRPVSVMVIQGQTSGLAFYVSGMYDDTDEELSIEDLDYLESLYPEHLNK